MERVAAWHASGQSARAFAKGKGYTAGALYYWKRRLEEQQQTAPGIAFARVVRTRARETPSRTVEPACGTAVPLVVEFGGARLIVRPGFDRASLGTILDTLEERALREAP